MAVRNPDEVGSVDCTSIEPFDLNHFFGEDGKIYGYKNLKVKDCYWNNRLQPFLPLAW